jgi:hypothetical protein
MATREGEASAGSREYDSRSLPSRPTRACRADVALLVEQLIRNQQVSGSNPLVGSSRKPVSTGFFLFPATRWIQVFGLRQAQYRWIG